MAPKKKEAKELGPDGRDLDGENKMLKEKLTILQYRLMAKDEQITQHRKQEDANTSKIGDLDSDFSAEQEVSLQNTGEMKRQYNEMQSSFQERIDDLQIQVAESKEDIEAVRKEIEGTAVQKDEVIAEKDEEIRTLTLKMESMAFEFADMLKETLEKMSQRIEVSHSNWDGDSSKPPLINRLKEFSLSSDQVV